MDRLRFILEAFYEREQPLGVAFTGQEFAYASVGRPATDVMGLHSIDGFSQIHFEHRSVSVFASSFGRGRRLIVQFPFQESEVPPSRPWRAFVRLAMEIQRYLDHPEDSTELPGAGVAVRRPLWPGPHSRLRAAQVPLPIEPE